MTEEKLIQHWNYFCSLAEMLKDTEEYVYHGERETNTNTINLIHKDVYSDRFKQIIILAASEFENITKSICEIKGHKVKDIKEITTQILVMFPRIIETEVITLFWEGMPLIDWSYNESEDRVEGIEWWSAYNALKHFKKDSYEKATLQNAVLSVASLYVSNLYLNKIIKGHMLIADIYPPKYFRCKYMPNYVRDAEGELPDFGNKSAQEVFQELFKN